MTPVSHSVVVALTPPPVPLEPLEEKVPILSIPNEIVSGHIYEVQVSADGPNREDPAVDIEKVLFSVKEAIRILSPPDPAPRSTAVCTEEEDMDILDLHTSPVRMSPPRLAFFRAEEPTHPQQKNLLPISSTTRTH